MVLEQRKVQKPSLLLYPSTFRRDNEFRGGMRTLGGVRLNFFRCVADLDGMDPPTHLTFQ
jgi:hypothetical protein